MNEQLTSSRPSDARRTDVVFGILLSGFMAAVFAGLFPLLALGFTSEWLVAWGSGVLIGWPLGFGLVAVVNRPLMRLAARLAQSTPR